MNKKDYERAFVNEVIPILMESLPPDVYETTDLVRDEVLESGRSRYGGVLEIGGWRYKVLRRMGAIAPKGEFIEYSIKRCDGHYGEMAWLEFYPPGQKMSGRGIQGHPGWKVDDACCFRRYKGRTHKGQRTYGQGVMSILDSYIPSEK